VQAQAQVVERRVVETKSQVPTEPPMTGVSSFGDSPQVGARGEPATTA
jgi:hypothetical protein